MKALSIKQPWAWLICAGYKDIENRNWPIGRNSQHGPYRSYHQANFSIELPCRVYVHAGKNRDMAAIERLCFDSSLLPLKARDSIRVMERQDDWTLGAIIGEVDITGCVSKSTSPWFCGRYGFVLANPVLYEKPIPCRGQLGFFTPEVVHA